MKTRILAFCLISAAVAGAVEPQKAKCSDTPLAFTISSNYQDPSTGVSYNSGIRPDSMGAYVNGQNGVIAVITTCNGSNSASLSTGSLRAIVWDLRSAVYTDSSTPSWTSSAQAFVSTSLNFSNILYNYNANGTYSFTTALKNADLPSGYFLELDNPAAQAPPGAPLAGINSPCPTALVNVKHIPATTNPTSPETWIVWADSTSSSCNSGSFQQVGTLFTFGHASTIVNDGQFSIPFYITIQKLP